MTLIERAIEAGLPNRNDEAKAYFLKARCEQNMYCQNHEQYGFSDSNLDYQLDVMKRKGYQQNFDKIASDYKNTSFYNEIISECKYFRYYVLNNH